MKVKVIFLPYIFQVLYVLCFTRPRYQVSVYRTIGHLVYVNRVDGFLDVLAYGVSHYDPKSQESPRIDNLGILGFVEFREFLFPFVMFYDTVTTQIRKRYDSSAESAAFGLNRTNMPRFYHDLQKYIRKYCTNQSRIRRKHVRIMYE